MNAPPLPILFQDEFLVIVDKPSGLLVHRGWGTDRVVAMSVLRDQLGVHVHPAHRLDRGTSGVLVFALSPEAATPLHQMFEAGQATKRYFALVRGIAPESGIIDSPVPSKPDGPRVPAVTAFRRLQTFERYSVVEALPRSGRLHQIRRHLKHITHPIVGDVNYGKGDINRAFRDRFGLRRIALHAASIEFVHPFTGAPIRAEAPLPPDLAEPFARMGLPTVY